MDVDTIYLKSPLLLKKLLFNIYAYRLTKLKFHALFEQRLRELEDSQWYPLAELENLQQEKLGRLVTHCYDNVPYYRQLLERLRLKPADIRTPDDLHKLPILTKAHVKAHFHELKATKFKKGDMVLTNTSGTTGSPLLFYWDKLIFPITRAYAWRQWQWASFDFADKRITMHGRMIVEPGRRVPPFWMYNKWDKQLFFSTYHLSEEHLRYFVDKMLTFAPQAIEAYPSAVYVVAKYMRERGITYRLKAVFTSAETLYPVQRELVEHVFQCRIFDIYGLSERVVMATECEEHTGLHLNMEYGVTEVVDDDDHQLPPGRRGRVVSTGLENYSMPLIRYDTGDVSEILASTCTCGRQFPMLAPVTTKAEDQVLLPDGRYISGSLLTFPFKPMVNIVKSQIVQEDPTNVTVKIVKNDSYSDDDSRILLDRMRKCLGPDVRVGLEFVDDIPRTKHGKYRWVISKVRRDMDIDKQDS